MLTFHSLAKALKDGYQVHDSRPGSLTLRKMVDGVWVMAMCEPEHGELRPPEHAWDDEC